MHQNAGLPGTCPDHLTWYALMKPRNGNDALVREMSWLLGP